MVSNIRILNVIGGGLPELKDWEVEQIVVDDVLGSGTNITDWTGFGDEEDDITVDGQEAG